MFCLSDLCRCLGLTAKIVNQRLGDGVVSKYPIIDNLGRTQQALFVNEDGLYDVILDSRKPEAKAFRKWITSEVLPSIRKTGSYSVQPTVPQTYLEALEALVEAEKEKQRLELESKQQQAVIEQKQVIIEQKDEEISIKDGKLKFWNQKGNHTMPSCRAKGLSPLI